MSLNALSIDLMRIDGIFFVMKKLLFCLKIRKPKNATEAYFVNFFVAALSGALSGRDFVSCSTNFQILLFVFSQNHRPAAHAGLQ